MAFFYGYEPFAETDGLITITTTPINLLTQSITFGFTEDQVLAASGVIITAYSPAMYNFADAAVGHFLDAKQTVTLIGANYVRNLNLMAQTVDSQIFITLMRSQ